MKHSRQKQKNRTLYDELAIVVVGVVAVVVVVVVVVVVINSSSSSSIPTLVYRRYDAW